MNIPTIQTAVDCIAASQQQPVLEPVVDETFDSPPVLQFSIGDNHLGYGCAFTPTWFAVPHHMLSSRDYEHCKDNINVTIFDSTAGGLVKKGEFILSAVVITIIPIKSLDLTLCHCHDLCNSVPANAGFGSLDNNAQVLLNGERVSMEIDGSLGQGEVFKKVRVGGAQLVPGMSGSLVDTVHVTQAGKRVVVGIVLGGFDAQETEEGDDFFAQGVVLDLPVALRLCLPLVTFVDALVGVQTADEGMKPLLLSRAEERRPENLEALLGGEPPMSSAQLGFTDYQTLPLSISTAFNTWLTSGATGGLPVGFATNKYDRAVLRECLGLLGRVPVPASTVGVGHLQCWKPSPLKARVTFPKSQPNQPAVERRAYTWIGEAQGGTFDNYQAAQVYCGTAELATGAGFTMWPAQAVQQSVGMAIANVNVAHHPLICELRGATWMSGAHHLCFRPSHLLRTTKDHNNCMTSLNILATMHGRTANDALANYTTPF